MKHATAFLGSMALLVLSCQAYYLPGYMGCYEDDGLAYLSHSVSSDDSVEGCQASCKAAGYLFAGLQDSIQQKCVCGNDVSQLTWANEGDCYYPCNGNFEENCGGASVKSVYQTSLPNNFVGCYQDDASNPDFGSYQPVYTTGGGMYTDNCAAHCGWQLYQYFAVQNGTDCRCSNDLPAYSQAPMRECNAQCTWYNWQQYTQYPNMACGGPSRNSFYKRPNHHFGYQGCFRDDGNRVLPDYITDIYGQNSASALGCVAWCKQRTHWQNHPINPYMNETYAGVEYGGECYCGDGTKMNTGPYVPIPEAWCTMPCNNDPSQKCGGSWSINIWHETFNVSDL